MSSCPESSAFGETKGKLFRLKIELTSLKHISEMASFVAVFLSFFPFCVPVLSLPEPSASAKDIVFVFTKEGKLHEPCVSSGGE